MVSVSVDLRKPFGTYNVERKTVPRCCVRFLVSDIVIEDKSTDYKIL